MIKFRYLLLAVAVLLAAALLMIGLREPAAPAAVAPIAPSLEAPAAAALAEPVATAAASPATASASAAVDDGCAKGGRLAIQASAERVECLEATRAMQHGNSRSYRYTGSRDRGWYLLLVTLNGELQRIESGHRTPEHGCDGAACGGVRFGRPDFNGLSAITFTGAVLAREAPTGDGDAGPLTLSGTLSTWGQTSAVCDDGVTLNFSDNSYTRFCPRGGNGYARDGDNAVYHFHDADGGTVSVTVDDRRWIRRVELTPDGLSCRDGQCSGSQLLPPDAAGNQGIQFTGSQLHSGDQGRAVVLNGVLTVTAE